MFSPESIVEALQKAALEGCVAAAHHYRDRMQAVLSTYDNGPPSNPGEPPHKQTLMAIKRGLTPLAETVEVVVDESAMEVSIGTSCPYAMALEFGTRWMEPRPAWDRTLAEELEAMENVLTKVARESFDGNSSLSFASKVPGK